MKEHPILFSGEMVRAILDGRKTQMRRVIKPQPYQDEFGKWFWRKNKQRVYGLPGGPYVKGFGSEHLGIWAACPYGQPGDRLWVRETFFEWPTDIIYRADCATEYEAKCIRHWKPSIHMPRQASRITLEVTAVRVERVQDITPADAWAEGVRCSCMSPVMACAGNITAFVQLWNSINAKRGYSWESNPWVWVIEFKVVQ